MARCFRGHTVRHSHLSAILVFRMLSAVCDTKKDFKAYLLNRENGKRKVEAGVFNP